MYRILIVDDEKLIRKSVRKVITDNFNEKCVVKECDNSIDGMEIIQDFNPDIIICDICMGQMSGLDMINNVETDAKIIIITGYRKFEYAKRAIDLKVFAFVLKPINYQELFGAVADAINSIEKNKGQEVQKVLNADDDAPKYEKRISFLKEQLYKASESFDTKEIEAILSLIIDEFNNKAVPIEYVKQSCVEILLNIKKLRNKYFVDGEFSEDVQLYNIENLLKNCNDISVLEYILKTAMENYKSNIKFLNNGNFSQHIKNALKFIDLNFQNDISLNEVAEHIHLSTAHTSRLFKKETGKSIVDYINEKKIEKGKELLLYSDYKIYEISDMLGFSHPHYFSTIFKRYTGMSPRDFVEIREKGEIEDNDSED